MRFGQSQGTEEGGSGGDRAAEECCPPPPGIAECRDQASAEYLAADGADSGKCAEEADRLQPCGSGQRMLEAREDLRHHHRRCQALRCASREQEERIGCQSDRKRGDDQRARADHEQAATPEAVPDATAEDETGGEGGGEQTDDEGRGRLSGTDVSLDCGDRDVRDGEHERGEERTEVQRPEDWGRLSRGRRGTGCRLGEGRGRNRSGGGR
ncbi:hypothetical protein QFE97_04520 [Bacillus subtilis]|nr:hypothetical protein QFE97_04520 [Bacillus subtilis]